MGLELLNKLDVEGLRETVSKSKPFPNFYIDNFLNNDFAEEVYNSFPSYEKAEGMGKVFNAARATKFPESIAKLNNLLQSQEFREALGYIMNIPDLIADPHLVGGGIHETDSGGRLDVHVDFNFNKEMKLFRRVNILIYFNKDWKPEYGGALDLWDADVKKCYAEITPVFNRMACFATSEISYHGVTPLKCPKGMMRKSFAGYYYTKTPHEDWDNTHHSTIFKQRPKEWYRSIFNIPAENLKNISRKALARIDRLGKKIFKKS